MNKRLLIFLIVINLLACGKNPPSGSGANTNPPGGNTNPPNTSTDFIKGADISWVTQMESDGKKFYNSAGSEKDCFQLMKDIGMNAIRLRVWVNPSDNWCNTADVVAKATRAKALGLKILLDFHYSDSWADPGKQNKPAAWANQNLSTLIQSLSTHTTTVLNALKTISITPTWVQIGNETNDGMLWPDGKASTNMGNFAAMIKAGYDAVKAFDSSIKVIVHISNGHDNTLFRWMFDNLKNNNVQYDIIGMSLYPTASNWSTMNSQCLANMNDMVSRYNKEIMVLEIGMSWDQANACKSFITDLIDKVKSVTGNKGLGVFYWEPESYGNWQGYTLGAFDNNGRPTVALDAFK